MKVYECMCNEVNWVKPSDSIANCAKIMNENHIGCVPVCDESESVIGLVTDRDIVLRSIAADKDVNSTPVSEIMTNNVCICSPETDIEYAQSIMSENQIRRIPVVEDNRLVGIITLGDLAANKEVNNEGVSSTLESICNCDCKNAE